MGAVLGPGVLALPSSAAAAAGPASILAWTGLIALSLPVALVFAALGARHPDGGGVSAFVRRAFGARAAAPVGWWFYWAVPLGVPAAALIGGEYVAAAAGWGSGAAPVVAALVLAAAVGANLMGLRVSGRVQLLMAGLLALLLCVTVAVSSAHLRAAHFAPFLPHGWSSVGSAASVLFFAFAGWEAISHLSGEFAAPERDLPRVTLLAWAIVSCLYLGLAVVTIGVLGTRAGTTSTPLTLVLERGIGSYARGVAAGAAVLLTFGAVNAYLAGGARLGAALAEGPRTVTVRRSLLRLAGACAAVLLAAASGVIGLEVLLRATSACLAAVTLAGTLAAVVLLPRRSLLRRSAYAGSALVTVVLVFCGVYLVVPLMLGVGALCAERLHLGVRRHDAPRRAAGPDVRDRVQGGAERPPVQERPEADPAHTEVAELGHGGTQR
jgi:amino acid efflux transporter